MRPSHAAGPAELSPHAVALCSALFLERPEVPSVQGSLRYHLNAMNADIFQQLEALDGKALTAKERAKKFLWSMQPSEVMKGIIESGRGKRDPAAATDRSIRAAFRNLSSNEWSAATEPTISAIVGRLRRLDADFSSESGANLAFGYEVRGRDAINAYVERVVAHGRALDAAVNPPIEAEYPHFGASKVIGRMVSVGTTGLYLRYIIWPLIRDFPNQSAPTQGLAVGLFAYIAPPLYQSLRKSATYALGGVFGDVRIRYENEFSPYRSQKALQYLDEIKTMAGETPSSDSFVYNSFDAPIPKSFATALSDAQNVGGDINADELIEVIRRRRRGLIASLNSEVMAAEAKDPTVKLMTDQFLFFDRETSEPVLVSFLRVKKPSLDRPPRRKKTKEEYRPIFAPEGALGAAR